MAVATSTFDTWLSEKLQSLSIDESVFGVYIKGILEGDESEDEKTEALEGILAGITVSIVVEVRIYRVVVSLAGQSNSNIGA